MHKLVIEQISRARDARGAVDIDVLAQLVSRAYEEFDHDRWRTQRSISMMIEEVEATKHNLEKVVVERTRELQSREVELHAQHTRIEAAVANMSQGLVMFDGDARLVMCNRRYIDMYGLDPDRVRIGTTLRDLLHLRVATGTFNGDPDQYLVNLQEAITQGRVTSRFVEQGDGRTIAVVNTPMAGGGWVATHEDITERRRAEMKIAHMARHDALTDLPNRVLLRERLAEALTYVERGQRLAVLCLDLDQFKAVNDTLGHPIGDELLRAVAARLRTCTRETDTVSRVGGDEFSIIQTGITDAADAERLARRIACEIAVPFEVLGHTLVVNTSIGIALGPADGTDPNELLKNADMALYGAKADGRGAYRFFEPQMDARMKARRSLEIALRRALEYGEFELFYQPVVNLNDDHVRCCEALLRWNHPERGTVSPVEFVPVAEEIGLIVPLGEWVIRRACMEAARWPDHICVAVNLSPTQLTSKSLLPTVLGALAASQLPAHRLELEITEAVLMQNTDVTIKMLHQLRSLGIRISMDDFGTGYSSLSYLRSFPFDKIKIDRCFINSLDDSAESAAIIRAVAGLANSLSMTTTAEGVETRQQLDRVRALGCTDVQGYFYSPPVNVESLTKLFAARAEKTIAAA